MPTKPIACPICKKSVPPTGAAYPFCGERCRLIDLGNWLGGGYVIPGRPDEQSELESARPADGDEED